MKITNLKGRSWASKIAPGIPTIHITNAEIQEIELKGAVLVIKVVK